MRQPKRIFEDKRLGFLRARFVELKQEGERCPTYNLCPLDFYNFKATKRGKKPRSTNEKESLGIKLYMEILLKKEKQLEAKKLKKVEGQKTEAEKHSVCEAIDRYEKEILSTRSLSAQSLFSQQLQHWNRQLGKLKLSELKAVRIQEVRDDLKNGKRTNSTINRYIQSFSAVLGAAVKDFHWLEINPCRQIRKLKEPRGRIRYLSLEEQTRLLSVCEGSLYLAVLLSLSTGARQLEIWQMRWGDIDFGRGIVIFPITKSGIPRSLPLTKDCLGKLEERFLERESEEWVFPSPVNLNRPNDFNRTWRTVLRLAEIRDFRWHDLRHTAGSYLAMSRVPLRTISEILGHSNAAMSYRYSHLSSEHLAEAINDLSKKVRA